MEKKLALTLIGCLLLEVSVALLKIEPTTSFVNYIGEVLPTPGDYQVFKAPTCSNYDSGYDVTVRVYNPHNPSHISNLGITYFTVSNKLVTGTDVPAADLICAVFPNTTQYTTECTGPSRPGDIYVYVTGNNRYSINYALTVEFKKTSTHQKPALPMNDFPLPGGNPVGPVKELQQIINYDRMIELPYLNDTLIHLRFCPSTLTGSKFPVTSILQATDSLGKSIIAQAMCLTESCTFDTPEPNRVGENLSDLPVNVATARPYAYKDLYIYAVAFNGEWQSESEAPVGKFRFGATTKY